MDILKTISENNDMNDVTKIVMAKVQNYYLIYFYFYLYLFIQEKELFPAIKTNIEKIIKDPKLVLGALRTYDILLRKKEFKKKEDNQNFLISIRNEVIQLISIDLFNKFPEEPLDVLRHFFRFFASNDDLLVEGLKFFSLFPEITKVQKFNSLKAFLFYFAYQTKRYNSPQVKELLSQELLNASILDAKIYSEFCMFCFYRGLYYIEHRNYFMATYLYCVAISMGLRGNFEDCKILNCFSNQMIRSLCFLKSLSDFEIKSLLIRENRMHYGEQDSKIKHEDINECLNYILYDGNDYQNFTNFLKRNKEFCNNYKLNGLKNEAEETLIFKKIKETLYLYKKIKLSKLAQRTQIEFNDLMKVLKKKVLAGEINAKYDEVTDVLEVFDVDPGLKERVERTKGLYRNIIDANKNLFINLKDRKIEEMTGANAVGNFSKEELELLNNRKIKESMEEEDYEMGNPMGMGEDMDMDD